MQALDVMRKKKEKVIDQYASKIEISFYIDHLYHVTIFLNIPYIFEKFIRNYFLTAFSPNTPKIGFLKTGFATMK